MNDDIKKPAYLNLMPVDSELDQEDAKKNVSKLDEDEFSFKLISRRDERYLAFYLLYAVDRSDYTISLTEGIDAFEKGFNVNVSEQSFSLVLAKGTLDERLVLDAFLIPFLKNWPLERLGCCTRIILRLALWELRQPKAISSIIINEAIELAKSFAEKDAYRFINGILDEIAKSLEQ